MATSREMFEVKGSYLSYSHFIGKINEIFKAFDCSETALEKIVLRTIAKYNQFRTKSKIKYPKSYLRVAVWETIYYYQQEIIDRENTPTQQPGRQSGIDEIIKMIWLNRFESELNNTLPDEII